MNIEWFGDNLLAASVQCGENRRTHMVGGHSQDRYFLKRWVGTQPSGDFPTIDTRHTEVEQNEGWPALACKPNRFVPVGGLNDSKPEVVEQKPHDRADVRRIIGDQDGGA